MRSLIAFALLLSACPGPIHPPQPGDVRCNSDYDCPDLYHCQFHGVDSYATCTWYGPEPVAPIETKSDAGH